MTIAKRARLAARISFQYVRTRWLLATPPLPEAVAGIDGGRPALAPVHEVGQLTRGVDRVLRLGRRRLRCLPRALVLYALLVEEGMSQNS